MKRSITTGGCPRGHVKTIAILLISIVCFRCEYRAIYTMYIDNRTEETVKIEFNEKSPYSKIYVYPDSLFFPPNSKKMLYGTEGWATKDGCSYTGIKEDHVFIYTLSGRKLKKNIWDVTNWDCVGSFNKGWEKTFVITENDLEQITLNIHL
jgi:hypothetical protein